MNKKKQIEMYGIDHYIQVIEDVHRALELEEENFEIKMILTEALNNAYIHGNGKQKDKPIILRFEKEGHYINFEIVDKGLGFEFKTPVPIEEIDILSETGRGLSIIQAFSESLLYKENTLFIKKYLK